MDPTIFFDLPLQQADIDPQILFVGGLLTPAGCKQSLVGEIWPALRARTVSRSYSFGQGLTCSLHNVILRSDRMNSRRTSFR